MQFQILNQPKKVKYSRQQDTIHLLKSYINEWITSRNIKVISFQYIETNTDHIMIILYDNNE